LKARGFVCIAINTPSFDGETDGNCSPLENHHKFFEKGDNLIIELMEASKLVAGGYIVNIGLYPAEVDAFPVCL
jgi:hypothetical protein